MKKIILLLCMSLLLTGCSSFGDKSEEKYAAYVELSTFTDTWARTMASVYFTNFGENEELNIQKDFTGFSLSDDKERTMYDTHKNTTEPVRKYLNASPGYGEADAKMKLLCDRMDIFVKLYCKDISEYYAKKEYETDNFAKGHELHKQMLATYKALMEANRDFVLAFYPKMMENESKDLAKFKEKEFNIRYYTLSIILNIKELSAMFEKLGNEETVPADLSSYETACNKLNENIEELKKIYRDVDERKKEGLSEVNNFVAYAESTQKAAATTLYLIKTGKGGQNQLISQFRRQLDLFISEYNRSCDEPYNPNNDKLPKKIFNHVSSLGTFPYTALDPSPISEQQAHTQKYNAYIRFNHANSDLFKALTRYYNTLGTGKAPTKVRTGGSYSIPSLNNAAVKAMEKTYEYADKQPSFGAIDNDFKAMYPKIKNLVEALHEAKSYYEAKDYVDDDYKKGQRLHTKIRTNYDELRPLYNQYVNSFNALKAEVEKKEMEELKNNDFMIRYTARDVFAKGSLLQNEMRDQNITAGNVVGLDLGKFKGKYEQLAASVDQLQTYFKDEDRVKKEGVKKDANLIQAAMNLRDAAKEIIERVENKRPLDRYQLAGPQNQSGTPENYAGYLNIYNNTYTMWDTLERDQLTSF